MAKLSLKNIVGKKNDATALLLSFLEQMKAVLRIEDDNGKLLLGNDDTATDFQFPVTAENEIIGWVKGDENAAIVAQLLTHLSQKEAERKKLGTEVLNLYQEVNLIFNFSEKLAQTIGAPAISGITLDEARHVIRSDNGVIVLWEENSKKLQVVASSGELFFDQAKINSEMQLLFKIILSGQSEILSDLSSLIEAGIILPQVKSVIYSALKVKHRIMGAIILASHEPAPYTAGDLKLLTTLALQSSAAIESALLYEANIREANEREKAMRRVYEATNKFVPYEFIQSLGHTVITEVKLGDQVEKIVTVLFSDIREYTTLSEQMTPEENFSFVCSFNERMGPIIRKHHGFINQYLGDAIMAIFPGTAADALAAAIDMQKEVLEFNKFRESDNQKPIRIGVGMHTGPLIMGITGDKDRMDAATISDSVNTASRIESLTKHYKANIILTDTSLEQILQKDPFHLRYLGMVQLKGKQAPTHIHECFSGNTEQELQNKLATLSYFNDGVSCYLNKSFDQASEAFQKVVELNPNDRTAKYFLGNTKKMIDNGIPENWAGVVEMREK
jgi:adenylate cyclase